MKYGSYKDGSSNNQAIRIRNYGHQPLLVPMKVFTCKYCGRRFLNPRALGGHQNAHKKERTIWMASMSNRKSMGMEAHALLRKKVQQEFSARNAHQNFSRRGEALRKHMLKDAADHNLAWHGSFHVCSSESHGPDTEAVTASNVGASNVQDLDLDLHL